LETLYPFILAVPESIAELAPRARVRFLSDHSRQALKLSAEKSNVSIDHPAKDEHSVPLPVDGVYWSVTHKPAFVGAVVAPAPVGIDLEPVRACPRSLFQRVAATPEWDLAGNDIDPFVTFFRYWTSKEAVLKACGTGLKDLSVCRIQNIIDDKLLSVDYRSQSWLIEHCFFKDHIASIVKNDFNVHWVIR